MKVLSVFDGISCAQVALERLGIYPEVYYASEVDEKAIQVTQSSYPETKQLGRVEDLRPKRYRDIDLLIGGSPCPGFSKAGMGLDFNDYRSKLFMSYVYLLEEIQPKAFIFENVDMKPENRALISNHLGVEPVKINSALVSAQNRVRLYWSNLEITQPKDRGILLKDVIDNGYVDRDKSYCIDANYSKGTTLHIYNATSRKQLVYLNKSLMTDLVPKLSKKGLKYYDKQFKDMYRRLNINEVERLQTLPVNYVKRHDLGITKSFELLGNAFTVDVIVHILKSLR